MIGWDSRRLAVLFSCINPPHRHNTIAKYTRLRSHRTSLILREAPVFVSASHQNSGGTPRADSPPFSVAPPYPAKLQGDKNRRLLVARFSKPQKRICLIRLFGKLASGQSAKPSESLRLPSGFPGFTSGSPGSNTFFSMRGAKAAKLPHAPEASRAYGRSTKP